VLFHPSSFFIEKCVNITTLYILRRSLEEATKRVEEEKRLPRNQIMICWESKAGVHLGQKKWLLRKSLLGSEQAQNLRKTPQK